MIVDSHVVAWSLKNTSYAPAPTDSSLVVNDEHPERKMMKGLCETGANPLVISRISISRRKSYAFFFF